jgi:hypothetical protein
MFSRGVLAILVGGAVAVALSGCFGFPAAKPSTSAPAFASDKEAYAAAEKTYRAYVDALNRVDLADPKTFEPVFALTTGDMNANDRKNLSGLHADQVAIAGESRVTRLEPATISIDRRQVTLAVCDDVSSVTLTDRNGQSRVAADRVPIQTLTVRLVASGSSSTDYRIEDLLGREGEPTCN